MRRTAQLIEEQKSTVTPEGRPKAKGRPRGKAFPKGNNLGKKFQTGVSGNPGGLPGTDTAALYARRAFDEFGPDILAGMLNSLRQGNAYAFNVYADRAFGKVKEHTVNEHTGANGAPLKIIVELVDGNPSNS